MLRSFLVLGAFLLSLVTSAAAREIQVQLYEDPNVTLATASTLMESAHWGDTLVLICESRVVHARTFISLAPRVEVEREERRIQEQGIQVSPPSPHKILIHLFSERVPTSLADAAKRVEAATAGDTLVVFAEQSAVYAVVIPNPQPATALDVMDASPGGTTPERQSRSQQIVELALAHSRVGMLDWKGYDNGTFRFVFVRNKTRYTVYNDSDLLTFWTRPNGSTAQSDLFKFTDYWLDDSVDFGLSEDPRIFKSGDWRGEEAQHPECQQAWQDLLNAAQTATLEFLAK